MKRRPDSTPTFWLGDPPPMLPRGQLDLPLVQAPKAEPLRPSKLYHGPNCANLERERRRSRARWWHRRDAARNSRLLRKTYYAARRCLGCGEFLAVPR